MNCQRVGGFLVMIGSADVTLSVNGKAFCFEFSDRLGPLFFNKRGQEIRAPGIKHVFWKALELWIKQGKRLSATRVCIWDAMQFGSEFVKVGPRVYRATGKRFLVTQSWYLSGAQTVANQVEDGRGDAGQIAVWIDE